MHPLAAGDLDLLQIPLAFSEQRLSALGRLPSAVQAFRASVSPKRNLRMQAPDGEIYAHCCLSSSVSNSRQAARWLTLKAAVELVHAHVTADTPGRQIPARKALLVLPLQVAKFFSCASAEQRVAVWGG